MVRHDDRSGTGDGNGQVVFIAARFGDDDGAMDAAASINAALEEAALAVDDLFATGGGLAHSDQVDRIYSRHGLRNTGGWCQERPLEAEGREVLWCLPAGALVDDAEQLLLSHGAEAVRVVGHTGDGWKVAPHPLAIPFIDEESGEVFYDVVKVEDSPPRGRPASRKRTLH